MRSDPAVAQAAELKVQLEEVGAELAAARASTGDTEAITLKLRKRVNRDRLRNNMALKKYGHLSDFGSDADHNLRRGAAPPISPGHRLRAPPPSVGRPRAILRSWKAFDLRASLP